VLIDIIYLFFGTLALPFLTYLFLKNPKFRSGLINKFKRIPLRSSRAPCLWVHAVSVGEVRAARMLIEGFRKRFPDWEIAISTGTSTGAEVAREEIPDALAFHLPFDLSWRVDAMVGRIRPRCAVFMELELWPNLLRELKREGVPVFVVNGRIRKPSQMIYKLLSTVARDVFADGCVTCYCVQNELYARRVCSIGVDAARVRVTGSMKYDNIPVEVPRERLRFFRNLFRIRRGEKVFVAGSTYADEERALASIYARMKRRLPRLRMIVAPRHLERLEETVEAMTKAGLSVVRRSEIEGPEKIDGDAVIIVDTMGELGEIYGVADVAFVGKSLFSSAQGGHNVLEPAGLGVPVLFGRFVENFQEEADLLLKAGGGVMVDDADQLERELEKLLTSPKVRREVGARAREAVFARRGATDKTLDIIEGFLSEKGS